MRNGGAKKKPSAPPASSPASEFRLPIPPCVIPLPPRNDDEAQTGGEWQLSLPEGVNFEGQHFLLPGGCSVKAEAQWMEPPGQGPRPGGLLSVKLSLRGEALAPCARCLRQTPLAISDDLMYLYCSSGASERDSHGFGGNLGLGSELRSELLGNDEDDAGDEGVMPVDVEFFGRTLDLAPQVWETLLLLLPTKVLCKEGCAGLCPSCGADLNEGPCSCKVDAGDPRFEALRSLSLE